MSTFRFLTFLAYYRKMKLTISAVFLILFSSELIAANKSNLKKFELLLDFDPKSNAHVLIEGNLKTNDTCNQLTLSTRITQASNQSEFVAELVVGGTKVGCRGKERVVGLQSTTALPQLNGVAKGDKITIFAPKTSSQWYGGTFTIGSIKLINSQ